MQMDVERGLNLIGKITGEKIENYTDKTGQIKQKKTIAVNCGDLQNIIVEVPSDYKIKSDKDGNVALPIKTSARQWDNASKSFQFVNVTYYVPTIGK